MATLCMPLGNGPVCYGYLIVAMECGQHNGDAQGMLDIDHNHHHHWTSALSTLLVGDFR